MKHLAIIALLASCAPAHAQSNCMTTEQAHTELADMYGEELVFVAIHADGTIVEIWGADLTWTMIQTFANGVSCYVAHGQGYDIPIRKANL